MADSNRKPKDRSARAAAPAARSAAAKPASNKMPSSVDPSEWSLDSVSPERHSGVGPPSSPSRPEPIGADLALDDEVGFAPELAIEGTRLPSMRPAASLHSRTPQSGPRSQRDIRVRRHARPTTGWAMVFAAVLLVAALALVVPFLYPDGIAWLTRELGGYAPVPLIVYGVVLFAAWVVVTAKGYQLGSAGLYVASLGIVAFLICIGLSSASIISGSVTALAYRRLMPMMAPLALAGICLGFAAAAAGRARMQFKGEERRIVYGLTLALLALASLALGVRAARVDLAIPRLGTDTDWIVWQWF